MSAPIPDKRIKKLVPTADKRRVRRDEKAALDPTNRGDQRKVRLKGGVEIPFSLAVQKATRWLRLREGHAEASVEELSRGMADNDCRLDSDLSHPVNSELLELLRNSERVEASYAGQKLMLSLATVSGIKLSVLEKNTYKTEEVQRDIKRLIDGGDPALTVVAIPRSDLGQGEKMLFAASKIARASDELRDLWHAARVPAGDKLTAELVRAGKRSEDDLKAREERKVAARQRRAELSKKPIKRRRGVIRNATNAHLQQG